MREQTITRRLAPGFHPGFSIQRQGVLGDHDGDTVTIPGDLLWCDYGHIGMGTHGNFDMIWAICHVILCAMPGATLPSTPPVIVSTWCPGLSDADGGL